MNCPLDFLKSDGIILAKKNNKPYKYSRKR